MYLRRVRVLVREKMLWRNLTSVNLSLALLAHTVGTVDTTSNLPLLLEAFARFSHSHASHRASERSTPHRLSADPHEGTELNLFPQIHRRFRSNHPSIETSFLVMDIVSWWPSFAHPVRSSLQVESTLLMTTGPYPILGGEQSGETPILLVQYPCRRASCPVQTAALAMLPHSSWYISYEGCTTYSRFTSMMTRSTGRI